MDNPQHWISAPPPSDTPYTDSIARQCFHWGDLIIFMRELERKLHASERDLKTLTESIALSREAVTTARGRLEKDTRSDRLPPSEIMEAAKKVSVWMDQNGHKNWQLGGLCDRSYAAALENLSQP